MPHVEKLRYHLADLWLAVQRCLIVQGEQEFVALMGLALQ